jgi:transposase
MDAIDERCRGLGIHKRTAVACAITAGPGGRPRKESRPFSPMTDDRLARGDWLAERRIGRVAMESTGVSWRPSWTLLADRSEPLLVDARRVKAVPGRKTDVNDSGWLADLLRRGLLEGGFGPDRPKRRRRERTRYWTSPLRERTAGVDRVQQTPEGANIEPAAVATDVPGTSGREVLEAPVAGTAGAAAPADSAKGKPRAKPPQIGTRAGGALRRASALPARAAVGPLDLRDETAERVGAATAGRLRPFLAAPERLDTIPGVGRRPAEVPLAELGPDRRRLPAAAHLASWAGRCPGHHGSAGCPLGEAAERHGARGQSVVPGGAGGSGAGGRPDQAGLPGRAIPAAGGPPRQDTGGRRRGPRHPGHRLPPARGGQHVPRAGGSLL